MRVVNNLSRFCIAAAVVTSALFAFPGIGAATVYSLSGDYSDLSNPNGAWSFTQGATPLAHYAQPSDGNALNPAATNGFYGAGPDFSIGPIILKTTQDGSATSPGSFPNYSDNDFLTGDVLVHGTNSGGGADVFINWTAPTAGLINFNSSLWYAHGGVVRSQDITAFLGATNLGTVTITNGVTRSTAITSLNGAGLSVSSGDVLAFRFVPTSGQTFGSLTGISATVDFTAASGAIPEPGTWALMILGFGTAGGMLRRRRSEAEVTT